MTTITIRVIVLAHVAHMTGWVLIGSTPLLVEEFGLPVYLSGALSIPFFAIALWMYNAAAPRTDAEAKRASS